MGLQDRNSPGFDRSMLVAALLLLLLSIVLIGSASIMESERLYGGQFYLLTKHVVSIGVAVGCAFIAAMIPTRVLEKYSLPLLFCVLMLLVLVLLIGRNVNEARRWISLGVFNLQPAETLKLAWLIFLSSFVSHRPDEVRTKIRGLLKPAAAVFIIAVLLLAQPDFGSFAVCAVLCFGILWIAGSPLRYYFVMIVSGGIALALMMVSQPYRVQRLLTFMDPWADEFGSGYQLTQSLMAFGRGGLFGQGLGNSIQKLGYLPEAHTDFVTAIMGEEFGFVGMCAVIAVEFFIICKAIHLGFKILRQGPAFQGFLACGIGFWFCLQTTINIGVASGALPTKGLTLPLVSFGGSSMIVCCAAVAILLRIDFEFRRHRINFEFRPQDKETGKIWAKGY